MHLSNLINKIRYLYLFNLWFNDRFCTCFSNQIAGLVTSVYAHLFLPFRLKNMGFDLIF